MLGMVFGLRLRQSEGLLSSVPDMIALDLRVPDHTTLSRRARTWKPSGTSNDLQNEAGSSIHVLVDSTGLKIYGAGQGLEDKHGGKSPRKWRKLYLGMDADTGEIIAEVLTDQNSSDISQLTDFLEQIDNPIASFKADGAYDSDETYRSVRQHSHGVSIIVPPRTRPLPTNPYGPPDQRDWHSQTIAEHGRMKWQSITTYGRSSNVETTMGRYKSVNGNRLQSRKFTNQQA